MEKAFLKISEVAEVIGLGKSMVYKLIADGHIPSVKLAGIKARRVSAKALKQWVEEQEAAGMASSVAEDGIHRSRY